MSQKHTDHERSAEEANGSATNVGSCCPGVPEAFGRWGDMKEMRQMMRFCPCGGWMRRHRTAVYATLTRIARGVLILHVGWRLGVIAFFRTL